MPAPELLQEAGRIMGICNACRYCEGFCAVFPAMELRRTFTDRDLTYLAHLCHNCRGCYYACQYAPPHAFDVNVPQTLAELRLDTYSDFTWPGALRFLFRRNGRSVALTMALSTVVVLLLVLIFQSPNTLFKAHLGQGAFYRVVPYGWMVLPFTGLAVFVLLALLRGAMAFWQAAGGKMGHVSDGRALLGAVGDVLRLKYLDGGGWGCNYPDDRFRMGRRWLHHLVFYGFMACFAATTVAAIYDHFLQWPAPYPYLSLPVVLGTVGGVALTIGTIGLLYLKGKMDQAPAATKGAGMDVGFLILLLLTSTSGLLLLVLRTTPAMGILLAVHLGVVAGLFIAMPYSKFVHAVYRFAALIRNRVEQSRGQV